MNFTKRLTCDRSTQRQAEFIFKALVFSLSIPSSVDELNANHTRALRLITLEIVRKNGCQVFRKGSCYI